jgi:hypothetical protein
MAQDCHLCCGNAAPGFHEIANESPADEQGDKRNFLPQCVPVVFP